jgi:hypothetical protein
MVNSRSIVIGLGVPVQDCWEIVASRAGDAQLISLADPLAMTV